MGSPIRAETSRSKSRPNSSAIRQAVIANAYFPSTIPWGHDRSEQHNASHFSTSPHRRPGQSISRRHLITSRYIPSLDGMSFHCKPISRRHLIATHYASSLDGMSVHAITFLDDGSHQLGPHQPMPFLGSTPSH